MKIIKLIFILICSTLISGDLLSLRDQKDIGQETLNGLEIRTITHHALKKDPALLTQKQVIYKMGDTQSTLVHSSVLNVPERSSGNFFSIFSKKDFRSTWIEFEDSGTRLVKGKAVAVTPCLDQSKGKGGSLSGALSMYFSKGTSIDFALGYDLSGLTFHYNTNWKPSLTSTFSTTASYECRVPPGMIGQIKMAPWVHEVRNGKTREVRLKKYGVFVNTYGVEYDKEWKESGDFSYPSMIKSPTFTCITDLVCPHTKFAEEYDF